MGAVVPDQLQRARVVAGDELDLRVLLDRVGEIGDHAVERHRHRALGQRGRDALGDVEAGDALGNSRLAPSGKVRATFISGSTGLRFVRPNWNPEAGLFWSDMGLSLCSLLRTSAGKRDSRTAFSARREGRKRVKARRR